MTIRPGSLASTFTMLGGAALASRNEQATAATGATIISGRIVSIDHEEASFTCRHTVAKISTATTTVHIGEDTALAGKAEQRIAFSDLVVSQRVVVEGIRTASVDGVSVIDATLVIAPALELVPTPPTASLGGRIIALDERARTLILRRASARARLSTVTVSIAEDTTIAEQGATERRFADLALGERVHVQGQAARLAGGALSIAATRIDIAAPQAG